MKTLKNKIEKRINRLSNKIERQHEDVEEITRVIKKNINTHETHLGSGLEISNNEMKIRKEICRSCEIKSAQCRYIKLGLISICALNNIRYRLEVIRQRYKEIKERE